MKTSSTVTLDLKQEEANTLLEALLFASSINVGANWSERDINKMVTLSKKLKQQLNGSTKLNHIVFSKKKITKINGLKMYLTFLEVI